MKPEFFSLYGHAYPGLSYKTILQTRSSSRNVLHTHDYYELMLITSGCVNHYINGELNEIKKGNLFLIRPKDIHRVTIDTDKAEYINMNFSANLLETMLDFWDDVELNNQIFKSEFPLKRCLDDEECSYVADMLMNTMFRENEPFTKQTYNMKKTLFDIFAKFFVRNESKSEENAEIPQWLRKTVKKMQRKENFTIGYSQMVKLSGVSSEHLGRMFLKYYNLTPTQYINSLRADYMSYMLAYSDLPIIDIWLDAGFQSAAYAYKVFKKHYNVTPDKYRNNMLDMNNFN